MKKPKKKEPAICCVAGHTNENCMENVQSIAHCEGYNQAIDDYEKYLKDYESINAEKAREQYQQKWDIINGLPSEEEIKKIIDDAYYTDKNGFTHYGAWDAAKAISKRIRGE
tara:strand:+ start:2773 stop:3108 length:336 start_codon:yes stop_codon:yes gene_type:complete